MIRRRIAALAVVALLLAVCSVDDLVTVDLAAAVAAAEPGATLVVGPGVYDGPIVIDKPLTLTATDGVVLRSRPGQPALTIRDTHDVTINGLSVEGGEPGIFLRRATAVSLRDVSISGTRQHGIFAHDAEMHVTGCTISDVEGVRPQGIEIINSDSRPTSTVEQCVIQGPLYEGIISHVSRVSFSGNQVSGTERRGISVTEMSVGEMDGNRVSNASGAGLFCGDMSLCTVVGNAVDGIGAVVDGPRSALGHGIVVHYQSAAYIQNLSTASVTGYRFLLMLGSTLVDRPFDPDDRTQSIGSRQR